MTKTITLLGSTGSIGIQTLDVVRHLGNVRVAGLAANANIELLEEQIREFKPDIAAAADVTSALLLSDRVADTHTRVLSGERGVIETACWESADTAVIAIVGNAGIRATYEAARAGKDIALANKETLVSCGSILTDEVKNAGVNLIPIDSEHSAIFQCLRGSDDNPVKRILLTASGGPFRELSAQELENVRAADALKHPTWKMGPKITVDSATLMNKGAEVIEARWFFDVAPEMITVHVHPQSIVHSAAEFADGSVIAQMGTADMRVPIQYALTWPARLPSLSKPLDLFAVKSLDFFEPDIKKFPCLRLAYEAMDISGTMPAVMNAANEMAVAAFLKDQIRFTQIPRIIERVMLETDVAYNAAIETVLEADRQARVRAAQAVRAAAFANR